MARVSETVGCARALVLALVAIGAIGGGVGCRAAEKRPAPELSSTERPPPHVAMPLPQELGSKPEAPNNLVVYFGGHVISSVKVYNVNWGPNVDPNTVSTMPQFWPAVVNSPYLDWLEEYDTIGLTGQDMMGGTNQHIQRGTYGKAITITPTTQASPLTEGDIANEVAAQIQSNGLPQPDLDKDGNPIAIYMIDFPPNLSFTLLGTTGFCAYHWSVLVGGKQVPFGVHPDLNTWLSGTCNNSYTAGQIHTHELMEAITDTETGAINWGAGNYARPAAWASNGDGEVGDVCVYMSDIKGMVGSWSVQKIWSNAAGACVDQFPVCGGANVYPNCHRCTKFDNGTLCSGMTPVCETNQMSMQFGNCVPCVDSTTCMGSSPICDTTSDTCRGCTAADCMGAKPVCEAAEAGAFAGQCVQCDATHTAACTGMTPKCDTTLDQCVGCLTNADCTGSKPICDKTSHTCRGCTSNADCKAPDPACDTSNDATKGQCVPCMTSMDCPSGDSCDTSTHTCKPAVEAGPSPDAGSADGSGNGDDGGNGDSGSSGSCGCRVVGGSEGQDAGAGLVALALGLVLSRRSRRSPRRPSRLAPTSAGMHPQCRRRSHR